METQITLYQDEIKKAIKYYIENILNEKVVINKYYKNEAEEIQICHSEDDRASGVFNYCAYVKIEN